MTNSFSMKAKIGAVDNSPDPFELDGDPDIIAVFDADELAFIVAAACEQRMVRVTNSRNNSGGILKNRTEFKKIIAGLEVPEGFFSYEDVQVAEPIQNAISTLKKRIAKQAKRINAGSYELYIGGKDNFRDSLPLPSKYKSNRKGTVKPLLLKEVRSYLIDYKGAIVIDGRETDDKVTSRMYDGFKSGKMIVGITQDKDATQCSGWYLNPNKDDPPILIKGFGELYIDSSGAKDKVRGLGRKFLYLQCLIGDDVDGYNPRELAKRVSGKLPTYGEKTAYKQMLECDTDKKCLQLIADTYKKWFGEGEFTYECWEGKSHTITWVEAFQMYFDCAFMERWEGDKPRVLTMLNKFKVYI
jgi:hypothetical protein